MSGMIRYYPGALPSASFPLARFLPVIPTSVAVDWLREFSSPGAWVLDPFGVSPFLPVELAKAGYRVLVTANNPISRFLLEITAQPVTKSQFKAALAELAASPKGTERLEPYIHSLYQTVCRECENSVEAQAFIWERNAMNPTSCHYTCSHCGNSGEFPVTQADLDLLKNIGPGGLHRARALERIAPVHDPDRTLVEEALAVYPTRAVYVLLTLINKLENISQDHRLPLEALLLAIFDESNALWPYPATRNRPKTLTIPPRFQEKNIWFALEETIDNWMAISRSTGQDGNVPLVYWPEIPPNEGGICLFEGPLRNLADMQPEILAREVVFSASVAAIPRPNQAYWTLSALWAGWLWGQEASTPFRKILHRRRYDWAWHTGALFSAFSHLKILLPSGAFSFGLMGETESGFLSSVLLSAGLAGFECQGLAIREEDELSQFSWISAEDSKTNKKTQPTILKSDRGANGRGNIPGQLRELATKAANKYLLSRAEPSSYLLLHAAALGEISNFLISNPFPDKSPSELYEFVQDTLQLIFSHLGDFIRYGGGKSDPESGLRWLKAAQEQKIFEAQIFPLADRVEMEILKILQKQSQNHQSRLEEEVCKLFPGLYTPPQGLILACLHSYAEQVPIGSKIWTLKSQEEMTIRRAELLDIRHAITRLGQKLGLQIEDAKRIESTEQPLILKDHRGKSDFLFFTQTSAALHASIFQYFKEASIWAGKGSDSGFRKVMVLPGSRGGLVAFKLNRNPNLREIIQSDWILVKYRHIRRLLENETLTLKEFTKQLGKDSFEKDDPQMLLL